MHNHPLIIQGGMGIGVSNWQLARAVSLEGQMGVVSGTCIDTILVRRLQDGDPGGHIRRAFEAFPLQEICEFALKKYFIEEGRKSGQPYKLLPILGRITSCIRQQLIMLASFVEVYLAKEKHTGVVGMNLLTKIQLPNLATIYGAMMAGVDYLLMGAGIPRDIPGVLQRFISNEPATIKLEVEGNRTAESIDITFDPRKHFENNAPVLSQPKFLPIISSHSLAQMLARKATGPIDGFIVESHVAGGHNAPPRGATVNGSNEELVYTERDNADLEAMKKLNIPFWLAGGQGTPLAFKQALDQGASGIQVGTLFAFSKESGLTANIKKSALEQALTKKVQIVTDKDASPTSFPFKVVNIPDTISEAENYAKRPRLCDLGYLRTACTKEDGSLVFRCPGEPINNFLEKGGELQKTVGKKCLCNSLFSAVGLGQTRKDGYSELPLLTSGDQLKELADFVKTHGIDYSAKEVLTYLTSA